MKIAICHGNLNVGGVAAFSDVLVRGFVKKGHQATILTTYNKGNYFDEAQRLGWPVINVSGDERSLKKRMSSIYKHLCKDYDVVILNHALEVQLIIPVLSDKVIIIAVQHNASHRSTNEYLWNSIYYDAWIAVGPIAFNFIKNTVGFKSKEKVKMVPNGIDVEKPSVSKAGIKDNFSIIYAGRIENKIKNVLLVPDIANELRKKNIKFKITIAGDGPDLEALKDKIRKLLLTELVDCIGRVTKSKVYELMSAADYMLLPSFSEGLPYSLVEAMGAETLPIASDIPEITWVIGENSRYLVTPPNDVLGFAEKIVKLSEDQSLSAKIRLDLLRRQKKEFSEKACVDGYLKIVDECIHVGKDHSRGLVSFNHLTLPFWAKLQYSPLWPIVQFTKRAIDKFVN